MVIRLHANARTFPRIRREIQTVPPEVSNRELAERDGVTVDTIRRWRSRDSVEDRSHRPHRLRTTLTPEQKVVVVELRRTLLLLHSVVQAANQWHGGAFQRIHRRSPRCPSLREPCRPQYLASAIRAPIQSPYPAACARAQDTHPGHEEMTEKRPRFSANMQGIRRSLTTRKVYFGQSVSRGTLRR